MAQLLGWPLLSSAVELEIQDGGALAWRLIEGGREQVKCDLPALITASKGLAEPRVPPVTGVMKAMRAPIDKRSLSDLGLDLGESAWIVDDHAPGARRPPVTMVEGEFPADVDALVAAMQEKGVAG